MTVAPRPQCLQVGLTRSTDGATPWLFPVFEKSENGGGYAASLCEETDCSYYLQRLKISAFVSAPFQVLSSKINPSQVQRVVYSSLVP